MDFEEENKDLIEEKYFRLKIIDKAYEIEELSLKIGKIMSEETDKKHNPELLLSTVSATIKAIQDEIEKKKAELKEFIGEENYKELENEIRQTVEIKARSIEEKIDFLLSNLKPKEK